MNVFYTVLINCLVRERCCPGLRGTCIYLMFSLKSQELSQFILATLQQRNMCMKTDKLPPL